MLSQTLDAFESKSVARLRPNMVGLISQLGIAGNPTEEITLYLLVLPAWYVLGWLEQSGAGEVCA